MALKYCYIFQEYYAPSYPDYDRTYDLFTIAIYEISMCDSTCNSKCAEKIKSAMDYNGSYLSVVRSHYYDHSYKFNNETGNEISNSNYPSYPHKIDLCSNCIKNKTAYFKTNLSFKKEKRTVNGKKCDYDKSICCPVDGKEYFVQKSELEQHTDIFNKMSNVDFILHRYEHRD